MGKSKTKLGLKKKFPSDKYQEINNNFQPTNLLKQSRIYKNVKCESTIKWNILFL